MSDDGRWEQMGEMEVGNRWARWGQLASWEWIGELGMDGMGELGTDGRDERCRAWTYIYRKPVDALRETRQSNNALSTLLELDTCFLHQALPTTCLYSPVWATSHLPHSTLLHGIRVWMGLCRVRSDQIGSDRSSGRLR